MFTPSLQSDSLSKNLLQRNGLAQKRPCSRWRAGKTRRGLLAADMQQQAFERPVFHSA